MKKREHEALIRDYGNFVAGRGWRPDTQVHPRDLMLSRSGKRWMVEAKILYQGNATDAVRAAVGQLLHYRYFLHPRVERPDLLALFDRPIGAPHIGFLKEVGIASAWRDGSTWCGSSPLSEHGLAER